MDVKDFLPNLEELQSRVRVLGLQHHARPKQINVDAKSLQALGTN
jgi:hypothetical protein